MIFLRARHLVYANSFRRKTRLTSCTDTLRLTFDSFFASSTKPVSNTMFIKLEGLVGMSAPSGDLPVLFVSRWSMLIFRCCGISCVKLLAWSYICFFGGSLHVILFRTIPHGYAHWKCWWIYCINWSLVRYGQDFPRSKSKGIQFHQRIFIELLWPCFSSLNNEVIPSIIVLCFADQPEMRSRT